jgi:NAD(P)H dehydrogenase (quinone)
MKCLVVSAHPLSNSLCRQLTDHVIDKLTEMGHKVTLEDLYIENFDPALTVAERKSYYSETYDSSHIVKEVKRLKEADAMVLVFPTWWFGFPAILKGWFDRVWGPGIAYDHASDFGPITPRLSNLKKVLAITTLGAPWWVDRLIMWQPVKRVIRIALLGACANNSSLQYLSLYKSEKLSDETISRFTQKIDKALENWRL